MFWGYDDDATSDDGYGYGDDDKSDEDDGYKFDSEGCYVNRRFENYAQGHELLAELVSQRENGEFLDVVVQVDGKEFPCHRAVLASTRYFKTMLSSDLAESNSKVVQLNKVDSTSFSKILDFLYTGKIIISKDDVQDILQAAHMLQLDKIVEYCREFIEDNLRPSNCLGVMRLADMYGFSALKKSSWDMAVSNFSDVTKDEEFLSLSVQELDDLLGAEHLNVTDEDTVVHSVIKWLDHAPEDRKTGILKILQDIHLSCLRVSVLQKLESHPVIRESAECLAKITAAKEKHLGTQQPPAAAQEDDDEANGSPRRRASTNLAIIVGGWKAIKMHHSHDVVPSQALPPQPYLPLQSIMCVDPNSQRYFHVTTLPTPVSGYMSVASAGRHLYVTGGRVHPLLGQGPHSAPSRQAYLYDLTSDTWLKLPDMPRDRAGHQSVVVDGKLFVAGGDAEVTSLLTMDCYDPEEEAWIKMPVGPSLQSSSDLTVAAFNDNAVFLGVSGSTTAADDDRPIDAVSDFAVLLGHMDFPRTWQTNRKQLCVHAFNVRTKEWKYADIETDAGSLSFEGIDILATAVSDKLYIRTGYTQHSDLYIFDAEENTLSKGDRRDFKENGLRAQSEFNYGFETVQKGTLDTICNYQFEDERGHPRQTYLPFILFGHSFLEVQKSSVGWYCRDFSELKKEELGGSDHDHGHLHLSHELLSEDQ
ncbi:ectoderm-neural cortex protein 1-like [Branchiostoma floridae x Branchiostoma belcheri]